MSLIGCNNSHPVLERDGDIDLEYVLDNTDDSNWKSIGYQFHPLVLETNDSCLLPQNSHIIYVSSNDIYITGNHIIYRFGIDGKFKNRIGQIGQGPMEHKYIYSVSIDEPTSSVHIFDGNKRIIVWTCDGQPVKEILLNSENSISALKYLQNIYIAEERIFKENKANICISFIDSLGNEQRREEVFSPRSTEEWTYFPVPIIQQNRNELLYFSPFSNSLASITKDSITEKYRFNLGKYTPDANKINDADYRIQTGKGLTEVLDIIDGDGQIFILAHKGMTLFAIIIDKSTGENILSSTITDPRRGGGIALTDDSNIRLWPHYEQQNSIYSIIDINDMSDKEIEWINSFNNLHFRTDNQANPCILIGQLE